MEKIETVRHYYAVMRSEVVEHISLRDQSFFLYLGASGVIMRIGLGDVLRLEVLIVIPFLGLGASYIMNQHDIHISTICSYLVFELDVFLAGEGKIPQWNNSRALATTYSYSRLIRFSYHGHLIILLVPMTIAIFVNYKYIFFTSLVSGIVWLLGVAACIMVVLMTVSTKRLRREPGR